MGDDIMKRTLSVFLISLLALTACGGNARKNDTKQSETSVIESTAVETTAPKSQDSEATAATEEKGPENAPEDLAAGIAENIEISQNDMEKIMKSYGNEYTRYDYDISTEGDTIIVNMYSGVFKHAIAAANGDDLYKIGWESTQMLAEKDAEAYQNLKQQYNLPDAHIVLNIFDKEDKTLLMISYLDNNCTFDISKQSEFSDKASTAQQEAYRAGLEEKLDKVIPGIYKVDYREDEIEILVNGEGTANIAYAVKADAEARTKWGRIETLLTSVHTIADLLQTDAGYQKRTIVIKLIDPAYPDITLLEYRNGKNIIDLGV